MAERVVSERFVHNGMKYVIIRKRHQITLPIETREKLNLQVGDWLDMEIQGSYIVLTPQQRRKHSKPKRKTDRKEQLRS